MRKASFWLAGVTLAAFQPFVASAQTAPAQATPQADTAPGDAAADPANDPNDRANDIVVTGTSRPERRLTTSISVSALDATQIARAAPLGSADLIRNVPGLRSEASGGEGNANIAVRGLPVASGGAKFVQFQEDGLPVLNFGDIAFATADAFVRPDNNVQRVEVVRGGSASTFTSNAPGAIINFISKTGKTAGGNVALTRGLDFDRTRIDADYGAPIGDDWNFHIGGFYRIGDGVKKIGYNAEKGGQIKANITRNFANGFLRITGKFLDDRAPAYIPVPIRNTGTNSDPKFSNLPGFDARKDPLQSPYFRSDLAIGANGQRIRTDVADGYRTKARAIGGEASFDLGGGWNIDDKFNYAKNSGGFTTPYAANVQTAASFASSLGGAGATLRYANGPNAGQTIANPATLNGNGLATNALLFNVTLDDFTNITNVLTLAKEVDGGSLGSGSVTLGYFKSRQAVKMDWHWNSYLQEVSGNRPALLDVFNAAGQPVTQNGLIAYGEPVFGNCCQRFYDVDYTIDAPYLAATWKTGRLNIDGSVRWNSSKADGIYATNTGLSTIDVNQDGVIQNVERAVPVVNLAAAQSVNYRKSYFTWSIGANYEIQTDLAMFARVSRGARFNADRVLFGGGVRTDGSIADEIAVNFVNQQEAGVKYRAGPFFANVTAFRATTAETNEIVIPRQMLISNKYRSYGLELEAGLDYDVFHLTGGATYTHARITESEVTPAFNGNTPYRQAALIFQASPSIELDRFSIGANIIGTTSSYASDLNQLKIPGYVLTGAFASFAVTPALRLSVNAQNIFNTLAITELGQSTDTLPTSGINTARAFPGRNISATIALRF
ncbi:TonB-dependent receptor [Sphingomonas sp. Leaf17]|uniref:TonB-dependent siderophore receptor n=1 Tax=Sphingomonas sp. Leaf17 TaxID=1735683 RepID=UPI0006FDAF92|nr:TonB-dependent receptor [Sphingomonas sp. Leaf17]KQM67683.1 TonB-dependent receptor [Sphingomonas sp. Leaf17]